MNTIGVLIPFLAGLLFGQRFGQTTSRLQRLNPLFGGSAFRTGLRPRSVRGGYVLIPFLAGLLFGPIRKKPWTFISVLIPFLAGLLFGRSMSWARRRVWGLNPLFGGSAFRTDLSVGDIPTDAES